MRMTRTVATAFLVVSLTAAIGVGPAAASVPGKGPVQTTKFTVTLTSQQTVLEKLGAGGEITYGWNELVGTATSDSGDIGVTLLGNVNYTNGSGPFFGFMTLKFASLATVGLRLEGRATKDASGVTNLRSKMRVIGGSAALIGAKGTGSFTGSRRDELGGAIVLQVTIRIRGIAIG